MAFKEKLHDILTIKFDQAFGLDISDSSVEIIELQKFFRFSAVTYGRTELPMAVVENGKIIDPGVLASTLKTLLKEVKPKVSTNKVIVSLPESQVFVECFILDAKLKSEELNKAVAAKMTLTLPLNIDKMYWDFITKSLPDKTKQLIIFIGVPKDVANGYVKFCNSIGLEVVSLCVESLSLARAILKKSDKQSLIMDIGANSTSFSFFDSNDKINMSIVIPTAGDDFTEAIVSALHIERPEAENLKAKFGLKESADNAVKAVIEPVLEKIFQEAAVAIQYYEETFKQKLDEIYLLGGSALLPGLTEVLKTRLGKNVQVVSSGNNLNLKFLAGKEKSFPLFANVVGLGMLGASGEFHDINLLKQMSGAEINNIDKLNLFKLGYLSRVNTIRTVLNNKFVLVTIVVLIGVIFAILLQQAQNFGFASASSALGNGF